MSVRLPDTIRSNIKIYQESVEKSDFVMRKNTPMWQIVSAIALTTFLFLYSFSTFGLSQFWFSTIVFAAVVGASVYALIILQNSRDLALYAEFMNAIFSSALAHSNKFCTILRTDGAVIYINNSLQEYFPRFMKGSDRSLGSFLDKANVSKEQKKMVMDALDRKSKERVVFDVTDAKNRAHRLIMSFEPLAKPSGFVLLYGHEFIERIVREGSGNDESPLLNRANLNLLTQVTGNMGIGAYIADVSGIIKYTNFTLEKTLRYDDKEIVYKNLTVKNIILQNEVSALVDCKDFEGEVYLQRKTGGTVKAKLNQKAMFDESGTVIGYATFINFMDKVTEQFTEYRRNNW